LRHWKADPRLKRIPFVAYTATYTEPADERPALGLGADAFILKPAAPAAFLLRTRAVDAPSPRSPDLPRHAPLADARERPRASSETPIRKLEERTMALEAAHRSLKDDIAARVEAAKRLREAEERLRHAQKMEAVGRLAGG